MTVKNVVSRLVEITACESEVDRQRCWQAGFDRHLVKPAHNCELLKLVRDTENEVGLVYLIRPYEDHSQVAGVPGRPAKVQG